MFTKSVTVDGAWWYHHHESQAYKTAKGSSTETRSLKLLTLNLVSSVSFISR